MTRGDITDEHRLEVFPLHHPRAARDQFVGKKAAHLARAAAAGLPVLPGFVVRRRADDSPADDADPADSVSADSAPAVSARPEESAVRTVTGGGGDRSLRAAWRELTADGRRPLVVRSSSPQEDTDESSMAGQFTSVLDVRGWEAFLAAVAEVFASARRPTGGENAGRGPDDTPARRAEATDTRSVTATEPASVAPMAVLVQPMLAARVGGVLFGVDPLAGRTDRMLVSAVPGGPDSLVSGVHSGVDHRLSRRGRLLRGSSAEDDQQRLLSRAELRRLAGLARRAEELFQGPQDIEFGFDEESRLWLFQSRPVTAMAARPPRGARLYGPGPVAETLPDPLRPLEEDLWVVPMSRGLTGALDIGGTAARRQLRALPAVTTVGGRAAADLDLLGLAPRRHWIRAALNPLPGARRLAAAWRVGRLRSTLPDLALDLLADVDRQLTETAAPAELADTSLVSVLRWSRETLVALHAQEALAGALLPERTTAGTAAGAALIALGESRRHGLSDAEIIAESPAVLALTPPRLVGAVTLPPSDGADGPSAAPGRSPAAARSAGPPYAAELVGALPTREALRLRIRWIHEFQVRLVHECAARLTAREPHADLERISQLRWPELVSAIGGGPLPADLVERLPKPPSAPLPDAFRLAEGSVIVAEREATGSAGGGRGVSAGRATGTAWDGSGPRPVDAVLVVRNLEPALAPLLPGLTGLVARTGSPLSHLALLAREVRLPAVVGVPDAPDGIPDGARVTLDGTTGEISVTAAVTTDPPAEATAAPPPVSVPAAATVEHLAVAAGPLPDPVPTPVLGSTGSVPRQGGQTALQPRPSAAEPPGGARPDSAPAPPAADQPDRHRRHSRWDVDR